METFQVLWLRLKLLGLARKVGVLPTMNDAVVTDSGDYENEEPLFTQFNHDNN